MRPAAHLPAQQSLPPSLPASSLQIALKHRKNKHGGQRIVSFVGSPVQADAAEMKKLGAMLKKNNVRTVPLMRCLGVVRFLGRQCKPA